MHSLVQTGPTKIFLVAERSVSVSPVGPLAGRGTGVLRGAGAECAVGAAQGAHAVHVQRVLAGFTLQAALTPAHTNTVSKHTTHSGAIME